MQVKDQLQQAQKGAKVSIIMYVLLTTFKLLFGYIHDSQALVADGLNNATDVVSSVALLIGLAVSMKPADDNHNYGHYRSEYIGSLIASFIMFAVSVQVILQGIKITLDRSIQHLQLKQQSLRYYPHSQCLRYIFTIAT